jgi:hypothetical protein
MIRFIAPHCREGVWSFTFGLALAVAYCPWITGAAATPRWIVLVLGAMSIFLTNWKGAKLDTRPALFGSIFLAWAWGSLLWSDAFEGRDQAWKLALYAALFLAGGQLSSLRPFYIGAAVGLLANGVLVLADLVGLIEYQQVARPSGLFVNGLYLAEFAALVMAGLIGTGLWCLAVACLPCLLLVALARGPVMAWAVAVYADIFVRTRRDVVAGAILAAVLVSGLILLRPETVIDRLNVWRDLLANFTLLGHGLGAYFGDAPLISVLVDASANRKMHANNDLLEIAYDLGAVGMIAAVGFLVSLMRGQMTAERLVILVFIVEGCFGFPFYLPWSAGVFCLAAGHVAARGSVRVRAPDGSGDQIRAGHGSGLGADVARSAYGCSGDVSMGLHVPISAGDPVGYMGSVPAAGDTGCIAISDPGCSS